MRFNIARLIQHQVRQGISGEVAILIIEHVFISLSHVFFYFLNTQIQYYLYRVVICFSIESTFILADLHKVAALKGQFELSALAL
jgi:hypothetical protein